MQPLPVTSSQVPVQDDIALSHVYLDTLTYCAFSDVDYTS